MNIRVVKQNYYNIQEKFTTFRLIQISMKDLNLYDLLTNPLRRSLRGCAWYHNVFYYKRINKLSCSTYYTDDLSCSTIGFRLIQIQIT